MITNSGDIGYCPYIGHSGSMEITWNNDKVVEINCGFGDYKTCGCIEVCEMYKRHPIGFTQTYPNDLRKK